jgi:hypothetical protein
VSAIDLELYAVLCVETQQGEWGEWVCPRCGTEHSDPESYSVTTCGTCKAHVRLCFLDENGEFAVELDDWQPPEALAWKDKPNE